MESLKKSYTPGHWDGGSLGDLYQFMNKIIPKSNEKVKKHQLKVNEKCIENQSKNNSKFIQKSQNIHFPSRKTEDFAKTLFSKKGTIFLTSYRFLIEF